MKISVYIATSVDGFIAREPGDPRGPLDWLEPMQGAGADYGYAAFMASVDGLVMGRATYDVVRGFGAWPFEGKRVFVLTHADPASVVPVADETFVSVPAGGLSGWVGSLAAAGLTHLYVDGGAVIRQFFAERLVTDLTLSVVPVLLGAGVRLFGPPWAGATLTLVESTAYPTGLVQTWWRVRGGE